MASSGNSLDLSSTKGRIFVIGFYTVHFSAFFFAITQMLKEKPYFLLDYILAGAVIAGFIIFAFRKKIFFRRARVEKFEYSRDLPENISAAELCNIYYYFKVGLGGVPYFYKTNARMIFTVLLEFVDKKYITMTKTGDSAIFTFVPDAQTKERYETEFMKILHSAANGGNSFTVNSLSRELKTANSELLQNFFAQTLAKTYLSDCYSPSKVNRNLETRVIIYHVTYVLITFPVVISTLLTPFGYFPFMFFCLTPTLIFMPQFQRPLKRNGQILYNHAKSLKRYINHFSIMSKREIEEVAVWEHYFVIATMLGINKKYSKFLKKNNIRLNTFDSEIYKPSDIKAFKGLSKSLKSLKL